MTELNIALSILMWLVFALALVVSYKGRTVKRDEPASAANTERSEP